MSIQNVPFWVGLSQASSLISEPVDQEEGNLFEKAGFWVQLQQQKWPNTVLKGGMKREELWGGAGATSLGTGMEKQPRHSGCLLSWASVPPLPILSLTMPTPLLLNEWKTPVGIGSGPKF